MTELVFLPTEVSTSQVGAFQYLKRWEGVSFVGTMVIKP